MSVLINPYSFNGGGGSGTFDQTGILTRVRSDDIVGLSDADLLTTWEDLTANNRDWVGTGSKPNYEASVDGHAAVRFNRAGNANTYLTGPDLSALGLTEADVFILIKLALDPPVSTGLTGLWRLNDAAGTFSATLFPYTDSIVRQSAFLGGGSDIRLSVNPTPSLASWGLYRVCAKTGTNNYEHWWNGVSLGATTNNTLQFPSTTYLGQSVSSGGNFFLNGWVREFFIAETKRDATQTTEIKDYVNGYYTDITVA